MLINKLLFKHVIRGINKGASEGLGLSSLHGQKIRIKAVGATISSGHMVVCLLGHMLYC